MCISQACISQDLHTKHSPSTLPIYPLLLLRLSVQYTCYILSKKNININGNNNSTCNVDWINGTEPFRAQTHITQLCVKLGSFKDPQ